MRGSLLRLAVASYGLSTLLAASLLPDRVPLHFDAGGAADRYGSRAEALLGFGVLAVVLLAVLAGSRRLLQRTRLEHLQVPHQDYWKRPEHEPELRRRLRTDLDQFLSATFLLCTAVVWAMTWASRAGGGDRLPAAFLVAFGAYLAWTAWWVWHITARRYLPPA